MGKEIPKCDLVANKIIEYFKGENYAFAQKVLKIVSIRIEQDLVLEPNNIDGVEIHTDRIWSKYLSL